MQNPSDMPLQIELVFLNYVADPELVLQTLSDHFGVESINYANTTTEPVYSIRNNNYKHSYYDRVTSYQKFPKFVLPPHGNQSLEMEFIPVSDQPANGLLLLRNNLTVFDYIELRGTGSHSFITVGGVHPGGSTPLHFEYTQSMMEACVSAAEWECKCTVVFE